MGMVSVAEPETIAPYAIIAAGVIGTTVTPPDAVSTALSFNSSSSCLKSRSGQRRRSSRPLKRRQRAAPLQGWNCLFGNPFSQRAYVALCRFEWKLTRWQMRDAAKLGGFPRPRGHRGRQTDTG
jgi:hypothetical protein